VRNRGQSILEIVIALAIFALIASSFVSLTLGSFIAVDSGSEQLTAAALADEGLEAVRSVRDGAWNELIYNQSAISSSTGVWQLVGEGASETIGPYTRTITFTSAGVPVDLYSKNVKSQVDWTTNLGGAASITRETRLTNWDSRDWLQTDWSGGAGAAYTSADATIDDSTVGELKLKEKPMIWSLHQDTGGQTWNDVFLISATDGFIVGNGGLIRRWNGSNWNTAPISDTPNNLTAVACSSASNCFAVGARGTIIKWDGSAWSLYSPSPTPRNLNSVFLASPNDGWAVGAAGTILHLTGGGFETLGVLTSSIFNMTPPVDGSPVQIIEWDEQIPVCVPASDCNIKFKIRVANDSAMTGAPWPPDSEFFTISTGTIVNPSYNGQQYVQYQVQLNGDGVSTPVLHEVRINYK